MPQAGPGRILEAWAVPNPDPRALAVDLDGQADSIGCRVYTQAMVCAASTEMPGHWRPGWNRVPLPAGFMAGLADGLYELVVTSDGTGGERACPRPLAVMILR